MVTVKGWDCIDNWNKTLLRIGQNDNTLTGVSIGIGIFAGCDPFNSRDDFVRLGNSIGTNTHLAKLAVCVTGVRGGLELDVAHREFFEGLTRNKSIKTVELKCWGSSIDKGVLGKILTSYQTNSNNLVDLYISTCRLQNGGDRFLAATLQKFTNLTKLKLVSNSIHVPGISDEQLLVLVDAIRGNHSLEKLCLDRNRIGDAGCETLSTLLTNPLSNLQDLELNNNNISNDGINIIIDALAGNNRLKKLYLQNNPIDTSAARYEFSRLICNTSSINHIYSSNHTLVYVAVISRFGGDHIVTDKMDMNEETNKSHVAIRKIDRHRPSIDMKPFFCWDAESELTLKGLPYILAWFEKAHTVIMVKKKREFEKAMCKRFNETRKLSAIYEFAKAMPLKFVTPRTKVGVKRDGK